MVTRLGRDHRDEDLFDRHPHRQFGVDVLDEGRIKRLALDRIDFGGRVVDDLVDGVVLPVPLVGPGRALRLAGAVPDRGRDRRVVAILVPAG